MFTVPFVAISACATSYSNVEIHMTGNNFPIPFTQEYNITSDTQNITIHGHISGDYHVGLETMTGGIGNVQIYACAETSPGILTPLNNITGVVITQPATSSGTGDFVINWHYTMDGINNHSSRYKVFLAESGFPNSGSAIMSPEYIIVKVGDGGSGGFANDVVQTNIDPLLLFIIYFAGLFGAYIIVMNLGSEPMISYIIIIANSTILMLFGMIGVWVWLLITIISIETIMAMDGESND